MRPQLNWLPVIASLLKTLQDAGFELESVNNGDEAVKLEGTPRSRRQQAKQEINATDESDLIVVSPEGKRLWLYIVLGNEPEETVCDYSCNNELEKVLDIFSNKWENKPCPRK